MTQPKLTYLVPILLLLASCASVPRGQQAAPQAVRGSWASGEFHYGREFPEGIERGDEVPMYRGMDRTGLVLASGDRVFVNGVTAKIGSREAGARLWVEKAFEHYHKDEYGLAVRRFNQAWLLDPSIPEIFHGFAVVFADHGNYAEALPHVESALGLGLTGAGPLADCAYVTAAAAGQRIQDTGNIPGEEMRKALVAETESLLARAIRSAATTDERAYVQNFSLRTRLITLEFAGAWDALDALESLGAPVPEGLRRNLEKHAPR